MIDYIKREDVDTYFNNRNAWYNFYETLESIPSADVVEVKHGKWMETADDGVWSYSDAYAECDQCHKVTFNGWGMNYCPNCGARMNEEQDDFDWWEESGAADAYADHQR